MVVFFDITSKYKNQFYIYRGAMNRYLFFLKKKQMYTKGTDNKCHIGPSIIKDV